MGLGKRTVKFLHPDGSEETYDLSPDTLRETERAAWSKLPERLREECVQHLLEVLPPDLLSDVRHAIAAHGAHWVEEIYRDEPLHVFHFCEGMGIRNVLRDIVKDTELPSQCWDDYYIPALEEACER